MDKKRKLTNTNQWFLYFYLIFTQLNFNIPVHQLCFILDLQEQNLASCAVGLQISFI